MRSWSLRTRCGDPSSRGDDGAVLVEFALAIPLIVLIFLGVVEYGSAFNDANLVERGVLTAGRTVSSVADDRQADFATIQSLAAGLETGRRVAIDKVIIYRSTTAEGTVPPGCLTAPTTGPGPYGVAGLCNVYPGARVAAATQADFAGTTGCTAGSWDARWCPTSRTRDVSPDRVGVWVQVSYAPLTGLLPVGGLDITKQAVYQLEPLSAGG
jgi:hypothetical protein